MQTFKDDNLSLSAWPEEAKVSAKSEHLHARRWVGQRSELVTACCRKLHRTEHSAKIEKRVLILLRRNFVQLYTIRASDFKSVISYVARIMLRLDELHWLSLCC